MNKPLKPGKKLFSIDERMKLNSQPLGDEYDDIVHELDDHITNDGFKWEAHVKNFGWQKKNGTMDKFEAKNGRDLLTNILPQTENHFTIFEFKKNGFAINNKHHDNKDGDEWYYILPACKDGFHRDWEHDAICAQDPPAHSEFPPKKKK